MEPVFMKKFIIYLSLGLNLFFITSLGIILYTHQQDPVVEEFKQVISVKWYSVDKDVAAIEQSLAEPINTGQRKLLKQIIAGRHVGVTLPEEVISKIYKKDPYYKYNQ